MDKRLEDLSDKVRMGTPIAFSEALAVIEYQTALKEDREAKEAKTVLGRLMRWFRGA